MHVPGCSVVDILLKIPKQFPFMEPDAERTSARGAFKFVLTKSHVMLMYAHVHSISTKV